MFPSVFGQAWRGKNILREEEKMSQRVLQYTKGLFAQGEKGNIHYRGIVTN